MYFCRNIATMAHSPETLVQYICTHCQVTHAGTPIHVSSGDHRFEPPETCGACGESEFVSADNWIHSHQ